MATTQPPQRGASAARKSAASIVGPLTLEQARAIAGVKTDPAKRVSRARNVKGRRRTPGALGGPASVVPASPTTVAVERRKLQLEQREERKERVREYKATLALLQSHGVKGLPDVAPAPPRRRRAPGAPAAVARSGPLRVLAEGDSWFDYPVPFFGGGLVPRLEGRLGVPILNLAKAGDETRFMLGVEQRQLIARHLTDGCPDGTPWELMLFSGGGNDIVAQPLALWLRDFDPAAEPAKLLNQPRFSAALALVRAAYEDLIEIRDQVSPQTHLAFHGYDFAIPDGRRICHLGPWLKPAFELRGFPSDMVISTQVVREMLAQLAAMLKALESHPRVTFINAQGTLAPVTASWHNEMHPSRSGFNQIADKFHEAIKTLFPGRVVV